MTGPSPEKAAEPSGTGVNKSAFQTLSRREEQVLGMAAAGFLDKQIGPELGVSLNTLRTYWTRIRTKVGEGTRSALAVAYIEALSDENSAELGDPDWEVDMVSRRIRRTSTRELPGGFPEGFEGDLDDVLGRFHPDDEPQIRSMLGSLYSSSLSELSYSGRMLGPNGIEMAGAFVRVIRDDDGVPIRLLGRHVTPLMSAAGPHPASGAIEHEGWVYDHKTGRALASDAVNNLHGLACGAPHPVELYGQLFRPDDWENGMRILDEVAAGVVDTSCYTLRKLDPNDPEGVVITAHGIRDRHGEVVRVLGYRSRVRLEAPEYTQLTPEVRLGFWAKDLRAGKFIMPDEDFCAIYRVDPKSPTLDDDIRSRYVPEDRDAAYDYLDEAAEAEAQRGSKIFRLAFPDGSRLAIRLEYFVERDELGPRRINGTVLAYSANPPAVRLDLGERVAPDARALSSQWGDDLIGRDEEVVKIRAELLPGRLITLVGEAGVGKSALAAAVLETPERGVAPSVARLDVASVPIGDAMFGAISLTLLGKPDRTIEEVASSAAILLLDNCDVRVEETRWTLDRLPSTYRALTVLATCRSAIGSWKENVIPVMPLALPPLIDESLTTLRACPAVQLFIRCAAEVVPGFSLDAANQRFVAAVVSRTGGNPSAIELAAQGLRTQALRDLAQGV